MSKLLNLEAKVRRALEHYPSTRDDDRLLALAVWCDGFNLDPFTPIRDVMRNKSLPSQESIGRIRRKIQEQDESLRGTKYKEKVRLNAQADYMDYAKGV